MDETAREPGSGGPRFAGRRLPRRVRLGRAPKVSNVKSPTRDRDNLVVNMEHMSIRQYEKIVVGACPMLTLLVEAIERAKRLRSPATLFFVAAALSLSTIANAGSAPDNLNAPIDSWLITSNASFCASVTPEDGTGISSSTRSNVFGQSLVIKRTIDSWGRTGSCAVVLPDVFADVNSSFFQATGVSDISFLWQVNIFGGPALTREQPEARSADNKTSAWLPK
jgi:hypothetical protein